MDTPVIPVYGPNGTIVGYEDPVTGKEYPGVDAAQAYTVKGEDGKERTVYVVLGGPAEITLQPTGPRPNDDPAGGSPGMPLNALGDNYNNPQKGIWGPIIPGVLPQIPGTGPFVREEPETADTYSSGGGGWGRSGGGGGGGSSYGSSQPQVMYADGWIPPFFGGQYTRAEWLAKMYPDDGSSGPAQLPQLPKSFNLDVFGGSTPGNPFTSGGYGGYGQPPPPDQSQLPLAKRLYQKYAGNFQPNGEGPTDAQYQRSEAQARKDERRRERDYRDQQTVYGMSQKPEWGMVDLWGKDITYSPAYDYFQNTYNLPGMQYLLFGQNKADKMNNPNKYKRELANMYKQITGGGDTLSYENLRNNLFGAGRGSWLSRSFQHQMPGQSQYSPDGIYRGYKEGKWKWNNAADQASQAQFLMGALNQATLSPQAAAFQNLLVERALARWGGAKNAKNNPGSVLRYLKRQGF